MKYDFKLYGDATYFNIMYVQHYVIHYQLQALVTKCALINMPPAYKG